MLRPFHMGTPLALSTSANHDDSPASRSITPAGSGSPSAVQTTSFSVSESSRATSAMSAYGLPPPGCARGHVLERVSHALREAASPRRRQPGREPCRRPSSRWAPFSSASSGPRACFVVGVEQPVGLLVEPAADAPPGHGIELAVEVHHAVIAVPYAHRSAGPLPAVF